MSGHYGVDSAADARTYYPNLIAAFGKPAFIGRYLPVYRLTPEERDYIHGLSVAILPLWNRDQSGAVIGSGSLSAGQAEAAAACAAWAGLGLPKGSLIVYDVEATMLLSPQPAQGWIEGCHSAGYAPGFYLNAPNGNNHAAGYRAARAATKGLPCYHFASQWELFAYRDRPQTTFLVDGQHAAAVPGYEQECVLWQSWENSLGGMVDLDCAGDLGLSLLWGTTPAVQHVTIPGVLKAGASHASKAVANPAKPDQPYELPVGTTVMLQTGTGKDPVTGELWQAVKVVKPSAFGWFPAARLGAQTA